VLLNKINAVFLYRDRERDLLIDNSKTLIRGEQAYTGEKKKKSIKPINGSRCLSLYRKTELILLSNTPNHLRFADDIVLVTDRID